MFNLEKTMGKQKLPVTALLTRRPINVLSGIWIAILSLSAYVLAALSAPAVAAVNTASVSVSAGSSLGLIPDQAFGVNTAVWDGGLLDTNVPSLLRSAGVTTIRFPGGSTSDVYHWQNNSSTAGTGQYVNPNDTFDNFMGVVNSIGGAAVITVNYGSNAAGTGGGDPTEAAAWVKYANVTKGYGIKYWEIGNEIYGNGEYGAAWEEDLHADHSPTAYGNNCVTYISDMKAQDPTIKVGVVLTAPGNWPDGVAPDWNSNVLAACGSKIDFVIIHWYPQGPGGETDAGLLSSANQIAGMISGLRTLINQYCGANAPNVEILVTETNSVSSSPGKQTTSLVNALFGADDYMNWLENGVTSVDWWDLHNGAQANDNNSASLYGTTSYGDYGILSSGTCDGSVCEPPAETPLSSYYGIQMLSHLGAPGDEMVSTTSNQSLVAAHAVRQANGNLSLLLINKDPANSYSTSISLAGYTPARTATTYTYGENGSSISTGSLTGTGSTFSVTIPPYSLTTIVMTAGSSTQPPSAPTGLTAAAGNGQAILSWTGSAGASSYNVKRSTTSGGSYTTIASPATTSYTNTGLTNGTTYYYVVSAVNAAGESANSSQVSATPKLSVPAAPTGLTAVAGNAQVALSWTASSGATSYRVKRSTKSGGRYSTIASPTTTSYTNTGLTNGATYYYVVSAVNSAGQSANSTRVSAVPQAATSDNAQFNFESGAQGWISSGGMITGVSSSTAKSYLGSRSLAVMINSPAAGDTQQVYVGSPATPAGATVTFHIYIPTGSAISWIQPYVQQGSGGGWTWTGAWESISSIKTGAWNTISVAVPANASTPLYQLGVQFSSSGAWTGTCYIDSVSW